MKPKSPIGGIEPAIDAQLQAIRGVVGGTVRVAPADVLDDDPLLVGHAIAVRVDERAEVRRMQHKDRVAVGDQPARRIHFHEVIRRVRDRHRRPYRAGARSVRRRAPWPARPFGSLDTKSVPSGAAETNTGEFTIGGAANVVNSNAGSKRTWCNTVTACSDFAGSWPGVAFASFNGTAGATGADPDGESSAFKSPSAYWMPAR